MLAVDAAIVVVVGDGDGGIRVVSAVVPAINLHADGAGELVVAGRRFGLGERVLAVLQSLEVNLTVFRSGDSRSTCLTSLSYTVYSVRGRTTGIDLHEAHRVAVLRCECELSTSKSSSGISILVTSVLIDGEAISEDANLAGFGLTGAIGARVVGVLNRCGVDVTSTAHNSILVQRGRVGDGDLLAGIDLLLGLEVLHGDSKRIVVGGRRSGDGVVSVHGQWTIRTFDLNGSDLSKGEALRQRILEVEGVGAIGGHVRNGGSQGKGQGITDLRVGGVLTSAVYLYLLVDGRQVALNLGSHTGAMNGN